MLGPDAADGEVPLAELPTLPKATLMDNFDRIVTDPRLRLAGLHVAVVLRDSAPADTPARIRAALVGELRDAGAVPPPIEVTPVPRIERDTGHGARFKLVRSTVARA